MIDIHSHILFGVDDGAQNRKETQALLRTAHQQGVHTIIATPHQRRGMFEATREEIEERYAQVVAMAEKISPNLKVLLGSEIYITQSTLERIEQGAYFPLGDSKALLVEFPYEIAYRDIQKAVKRISWAGYRVVLAHIERYEALDNHADRVEELLMLGCYTQINASSLLPIKLFDKKKQRKKRARYFLEQQVVHFVASDVHNMTDRAYYMQDAYLFLEKNYGRKVAADLCWRNQEKLLRG